MFNSISYSLNKILIKPVMLIKPLKLLGSNCPNCNKKIKLLKTYKGLMFCPHCESHIYKKHELPKSHDANDMQTTTQASGNLSLKTRLMVSMVVASIIFLHARFLHHESLSTLFNVIGFIFLGLVVCFLIFVLLSILFLKNFAIGKYHAGIDKLSTIQSDSCDYIGFEESENQGKLSCPSCQSRRMANRFWYSRITAKSIQPDMASQVISNIPPLKTDHAFAGCLNCHTSYQYHEPSNQIHSKTDWTIALIYIGFILISSMIRENFLVLIHPNNAYALYWQLLFATFVGWFTFMLVSWKRTETKANLISLSQLEDSVVNTTTKHSEMQNPADKPLPHNTQPTP